MRLNKFLAHHSTLSRRKADEAIAAGRVHIDGEMAQLGTEVTAQASVSLDGRLLTPRPVTTVTVLVNKPTGYVCSKKGQGSPTIYELLPEHYRGLLIAGRLDKDSSGLVVLSSNGDVIQSLTHPSNNTPKEYLVTTNKQLLPKHVQQLLKGVNIGDERPSRFTAVTTSGDLTYRIVMHEGRNRQIRRTLEALGYDTLELVRTRHGDYTLSALKGDRFKEL